MGQQQTLFTSTETLKTNRIMASSHLVSAIYLAAKNLGARKPVLLKMLNMMESSLRHPDGRFDLSAITAIAASTVVETDTHDFPIAFAQQMQPRSFSDIGYSARFSATIGEALNGLIAEMRWDAGKAPLRIEQGQTQGRIIWTGGLVDSPETAAILLHFIEQYLNELLAPRQELFFACGNETAHKSLIYSPLYSGIGLHLGQDGHNQLQSGFRINDRKDAIDFPVDMLKYPSRYANSNLHLMAKNHSKKPGIRSLSETRITDMTYRYLVPLLDKNGLNLASAAKSFGLAERTMRRRLASEGTCFRDVLEQVRRDICALYFLENKRSLSRIAGRLGYSELSAFTRAYTAWHGRPPSTDYWPAHGV